MEDFMKDSGPSRLAVVTGASSGIGRELAFLCAKDGYDLVVAADTTGPLFTVAEALRGFNVRVDSCHTDLSEQAGVTLLMDRIADRPVDLLLANAGHGLGNAFLEQDFRLVRHVIDTNITGTIDLIQRLGVGMRARGAGRILITGSIAGLQPGSFQAVYNGTKAFIDSFSYALRNELKDSGVTVTLLMPGPTDTEFFERAGMLDTKVGAGAKDDPAMVAKVGYEAMLQGDSDVVAGWKNKLLATLSNVTSADTLAEQHRKLAEPGTAAGRM